MSKSQLKLLKIVGTCIFVVLLLIGVNNHFSDIKQNLAYADDNSQNIFSFVNGQENNVIILTFKPETDIKEQNEILNKLTKITKKIRSKDQNFIISIQNSQERVQILEIISNNPSLDYQEKRQY